MDCYLLVFDDQDSDFNATFVGEVFDNSYQFSRNAWIVAPTERTTCSDLVESLRECQSDLTCVVVRLDNYNGWAKQSLWEKVELWGSS